MSSSKLDYLKKYGVTTNSTQEFLKKRLMKQIAKPQQQFKNEDDHVVTIGGGVKGKGLQKPKELGEMKVVVKRGFVEIEESHSQEDDEDFQPVIVGEDYGISKVSELEKKKVLPQKRNRSSSKSSSSFEEERRRKRRRRHDSSDSSGSEEEEVQKPKVDKDGDLSLDSDNDQPKLVEKAGLQTAAELKEFNRKQLELQNQKLMDQMMKQGNQQGKTVYRNADGQIVDLKDKLLSEKDRLRMANEQQLKQWKGGAKQLQDKEELKQAMEEAKDAPFARYEIDPNADKEMKMKDRFGDSLKLIKSTTHRSQFNQQTYRVIQTASGYRYLLPKCKFPGTVNRFNLEPGHRWDGVDRSNGYERKWIEKENSIKDNQEYHRKWAAEDM